MAQEHRAWIATSGTALTVAGAFFAALGPAQVIAGAGELFWVRRLAFVAAILAILGATLALRGRVTAGATVGLVAGTILVGTGSPGAGIVTVLGATLVYGAGQPPQIPDVQALFGERIS